MNLGTILVIDNDFSFWDILRSSLRRSGFEVHFALDGIEGIELANSLFPDLILLDIIMPVMDGYQVLRKLKESERLQVIPVVILSARGGAEDIMRGLDLGAIDFLIKPYSLANLITRTKRGVDIGQKLKQVKEVSTLKEKILTQEASEKATATLEEYPRVFHIQKVKDIKYLVYKLTPYFAEEIRDQVILGITEILTNAIVHGNLEIDSDIKEPREGEDNFDALQRFDQEIDKRSTLSPYQGRQATLKFWYYKNSIKIVIEDQGKGFDLSKALHSMDDPEDIFKASGRGIIMANFAFEEVDFVFPPVGGTVVTLIKPLNPPS